jgi:hypothetical protein
VARPELSGAEEAERQKRRKWWTMLGVSGLAGAGTGLGFVVAAKGDGFMSGPIPAWLAIAFAALYVATMIVGTIAMKRMTDEVEIHNNLWGMAIGGSAVLLVYPPWWMLWRGEVAPEPGHEALFLLLFASAILAYLWKKYR